MKKIKKAFTLIELMIVVVILGILMSVLLPHMSGFSDSPDKRIMKIDNTANALNSSVFAPFVSASMSDDPYTDLQTKMTTASVSTTAQPYAKLSTDFCKGQFKGAYQKACLDALGEIRASKKKATISLYNKLPSDLVDFNYEELTTEFTDYEATYPSILEVCVEGEKDWAINAGDAAPLVCKAKDINGGSGFQTQYLKKQ